MSFRSFLVNSSERIKCHEAASARSQGMQCLDATHRCDLESGCISRLAARVVQKDRVTGCYDMLRLGQRQMSQPGSKLLWKILKRSKDRALLLELGCYNILQKSVHTPSGPQKLSFCMISMWKFQIGITKFQGCPSSPPAALWISLPLKS